MSPLTVRQVYDAWRQATGRLQSSRTLEERQRVWARFLDHFGDLPLAELRSVDVLLWLNFHPEWASDWTLKRVKGTLSRPFNWAADPRQRIIDRNPLEGMTHPDGERGRPLEDAVFRAWLRASTPCFRRVLIALRLSGIRPGEMSSLDWHGEGSYIDVQRGCAVWIKHKTAKSRRDRKPRVVPLVPPLVKLLIWLRRHEPERAHVFANAEGGRWTRNALALRLGRLRQVTHTPRSAKLYGLRHRFATDCIIRGVDLATLAELLGHASTKMSEHYIHLAGKVDHLHAALDRVFHSTHGGELAELAKLQPGQDEASRRQQAADAKRRLA